MARKKDTFLDKQSQTTLKNLYKQKAGKKDFLSAFCFAFSQ